MKSSDKPRIMAIGFGSNMKAVHVFVPRPSIQRIDKLIERKIYPNRNEFIRLAIRDLLDADEKLFSEE